MNPLQRVVAVVGLLGLLGLAAWLNSTIRHAPAPPPNTTQRAISLDTARQKDIWRAEHTTFEIEQRFGPAFLEFVNSRSVERLAAFTSPTFRGQGLGSAQALERRHSDIIETIRTRAERTNNPLTAQQLADALLKLHSVFAVTPRASLRVLEIKEATPQGDAWTARLLITSTGTTESGQRRQVLSEHTINGTITDGTRLGEVPWITNWTIQRTVQRNGPPGLFQEVTAEWGLDKLPIPDNWKLAPGDVLKNRFPMAVADVNRDGRLDVAVAAIDVPPLLLAGDTRQGFRGVAAEVGLVTGSPRDQLANFAVGWIDFDNDGQCDIYVANMYSKMGRRIIGLVQDSDYPEGVYQQIRGSCAGNRLYCGRGRGQFEEVSDTAGVNSVGWAYGPVLADFDADGQLDIYSTTGFLSFDRKKPDG